MAKKKTVEFMGEQMDLFPVTNPAIVGISIASMSIKDGAVSANLSANTLTNDIAEINDESWRKGVAEWLVKLCGNNGSMIESYIDEARTIAYEREREREAVKNAMSNITQFPSGAAGALA